MNYDVIETGAGGGTITGHLALSGKCILLLDRGDWLKRDKDNWNTNDSKTSVLDIK